MSAQIGKITDFKYETLGNGKKLLAKVEVDNRVTNFLPVEPIKPAEAPRSFCVL